MSLRYRISVADARAHQFRVVLRIDRPASEQTLSLPAWIPGSYLLREFARHLSHLAARQGERAVPLIQTDKATWVARCEDDTPLTLEYRVYAFDASVRAAWLDTNRGFFNGTGVFLRVHGQEDTPHLMEIGKDASEWPKGWSVATAMPALKVGPKGCGVYQAANYDELVDHPVEMGHFWRGEFTARGVPHEFIVSGALPEFDGERLLADTQRICEIEIDFWHAAGVGATRRRGQAAAHPPAGTVPESRYVFMLNAVEDGYGGLEHRASTALIANRRDLPHASQRRATDGYVTLLGLISHEYFHTWNVKRLRPREFTRYDYTRENYTELLWFFEGFTSYYDDLLLLRAGLIDTPRYLGLLGKTITQVLATPGRKLQSVAQSSFDAWVKYYRPDENTANATVSYYTKGALVALALDLTLRTEGKTTLDAVMRRLWDLSQGGPIGQDDILAALQALSGRSMAREIQAWVHGTEDLPLLPLLQSHGVECTHEAPTAAQRLGARLSENAGVLKVQAVMRGSAAERAGLAAGDELLAFEQWRLRKPEDLALLGAHARAGSLLVCRDQRLHTLALDATAKQQGAVTLTAPAKPGAEALRRRNRWLSTPDVPSPSKS